MAVGQTDRQPGPVRATVADLERVLGLGEGAGPGVTGVVGLGWFVIGLVTDLSTSFSSCFGSVTSPSGLDSSEHQ